MNRNGLNIKLMLILVCLTFLHGCSSKFAYNNADWLANWYIDDYLDLNHDQNRLIKKELQSTLIWHRQTQLPLYKQSLLSVSNDLTDLPISASVWRQHINKIAVFWDISRNQLSSQASKLVPLLSQDQVDYLFNKLHEKNLSRLEEFNDQTIEKYKEQRFEKLSDSLEDYLGSLTTQQQEYILEFTQNAKVTEQEWFDSKLSLQTAMKDVLEKVVLEPDSQDLIEKTFLLMSNPDQFKPQSLLDVYDSNRQLLVNMLHKLSATLSPEQTEHFQQEITKLVKTLDQLMLKNND